MLETDAFPTRNKSGTMGAAAVLHVVCLLALMAALLTVVASRGPEQRNYGLSLADPKISEARLDADDAEARWPALLAKLRALDLPAAAAKCNCGLELKSNSNSKF